MTPEKIDKYLANELSDQERAAFEQEMEQDPRLKSEVLDQQKVIIALREARRLELKKRLLQQEAEIQAASNSKPMPWKWILVIASLIALSYIIYNQWGRNKNPISEIPQAGPAVNNAKVDTSTNLSLPAVDTNQLKIDTPTPQQKNPSSKNEKQAEQIFAMNFKPYRDEVLEDSYRGDGELTAYEQFLAYYLNNEFKKALSIYNTIDPTLRDQDNTLFLKANALIAIGKAAEAKKILEQITKNNTSRYVTKAREILEYLKNSK